MEVPSTPTTSRRSSERFRLHQQQGDFSVTSALDLTGTPTGLAATTLSRPPSPLGLGGGPTASASASTTRGSTSTSSSNNTISIAQDGSVSRRRLSWGRMERQHVDILNDPLRLDTSPVITTSSGGMKINTMNAPTISTTGAVTTTTAAAMEDFDTLDTDTPHEEDALTRGRFFNESGNASQSSLIAAYRTKSRTSSEYDDIGLDDDEVRLTSSSAMPSGRDKSTLTSSNSLLLSSSSHDGAERTPGNRRKSVRYSTAPSTAERIRSVKRNLRRMSLRVVNIASAGLEEKARGIRLQDDDDVSDNEGYYREEGGRQRRERKRTTIHGKERERARADGQEYEQIDEDDLPDLGIRMPIRGRTLGFFGPTSSVRLAMFRFLSYTYVLFSLYFRMYLFVWSTFILFSCLP